MQPPVFREKQLGRVLAALQGRPQSSFTALTAGGKMYRAGAIILPPEERDGCVRIVQYQAFKEQLDALVLGKTAKDGIISYGVQVLNEALDIKKIVRAIREAERKERNIKETPAHNRLVESEGRPVDAGGYGVWSYDASKREISSRANKTWQTILTLGQLTQAVKVGLGDVSTPSRNQLKKGLRKKRQLDLSA